MIAFLSLRFARSLTVSNGGYDHMEEGDDEGFAANPHRQGSLALQQR